MEKSDEKEMESGDKKEMESGDESMNEPEVRKQPVVRRSGHKMNSLNICYKGIQTLREKKTSILMKHRAKDFILDEAAEDNSLKYYDKYYVPSDSSEEEMNVYSLKKFLDKFQKNRIRSSESSTEGNIGSDQKTEEEIETKESDDDEKEAKASEQEASEESDKDEVMVIEGEVSDNLEENTTGMTEVVDIMSANEMNDEMVMENGYKKVMENGYEKVMENGYEKR